MENCIFCKIIKGDIPCSKVYEDESILAFKDINPQAPVHVVIIPKKHIPSLNHVGPDDIKYIDNIYIKIKDIAQQLEINEKGYRVVVNNGEDGGQTVAHLHFHLLGGRTLQWPPG